ncbi:hypothetical protein [Atopobium sp. oral taxon 810]|uniref:hypothetical protein n=1 Tax=Atopobium sp. oral taxon 810 TaxID=712158 RepID=UPI000397CF59|nr:hypothetical protein [Atopobium sp. oral taxon 810]ERI04011.1 hypothetical protein HMPREF9069_01776 [Atopobium sp. oral taxon 810 str. F0209]DAW07927.1 MAG TPA: hypothetical protein [Caudoviricetes sp.]
MSTKRSRGKTQEHLVAAKDAIADKDDAENQKKAEVGFKSLDELSLETQRRSIAYGRARGLL